MSMFRSCKDFQRVPSRSNCPEAVAYSCDMCTEGAWTSETEVDIHKKNNHAEELREVMRNVEKFGCLVCAKQHNDKNSLHEHIKTEHLLSSKNAQRVERVIFICDLCTRVFFNKMLLSLHIIQKHTAHRRNVKIDCPKCSKPLKKATMWNHLENHHVSSVSTCPICVEKCMNRKELRKHLDTHRKHLFCELCRYDTKSQDNFHKHLKTHRKENKTAELKLKKYFVPFRNKLKTPKLMVQNPMKGLLLPYNTHVCILCRQICMSIIEMKRHLIFDHTMREEYKKKCYMCSCGREFPNSILLKQHTFKELHQVLEVTDGPAVIEVVVTVPQAVDEVKIESDSDSDAEIVDV